jgi:hypothetical protein
LIFHSALIPVSTCDTVFLRNHAPTRFACFLPSPHVCVPRRDRRAHVGASPDFQIHVGFLAMIAIECIPNSTLLACLAAFYREIILAALLIMCNAAENFLQLRFKF